MCVPELTKKEQLLHTNGVTYLSPTCITFSVFYWNRLWLFSCRLVLITLVPADAHNNFSNLSIWHQGLPLTQLCIYFSIFIWIHVAFHPESGISKEGDKCHQFWNEIMHLIEATNWTFVPGREISFDKGSIPSKSNYNPSNSTVIANWISIEYTLSFLQMHPVVVT